MLVSALRSQVNPNFTINKEILGKFQDESHTLREAVTQWFTPIYPEPITAENCDIQAEDPELGKVGFRTKADIFEHSDKLLTSLGQIFKNLDLLFNLEDPSAALNPEFSEWLRRHTILSKSKGEYLIYRSLGNIKTIQDYIKGFKPKQRKTEAISSLREFCNFFLDKLLGFLDQEFITKLINDRVENIYNRYRQSRAKIAREISKQPF